MNQNNGVIVRRNTDTTLLEKTFGQKFAAAQSTASLFYADGPEDEPEDYIPDAGISTRRGSRSVRNTEKNPEAAPVGSPAYIVDREAYRHPEFADPVNRARFSDTINPPTGNIINKIDQNALHLNAMPIPSQENSIPKEFEEQMRNTMPSHMPSNTFPPMPQPTIMNHPRQFPTEDIPSAPGAYHPCPPKPPMPNVLPPTEHKPVQPTEDMIVKVHGYNETNVKLLALVSENIARCSKILADINNSTVPVNVDELMHVLEFMDNSEFRKILGDAFQNTLNKNLELSTKITSYLNGTAPLDGDENPPSEGEEVQPSEPSQDESASPVSDSTATDTTEDSTDTQNQVTEPTVP